MLEGAPRTQVNYRAGQVLCWLELGLKFAFVGSSLNFYATVVTVDLKYGVRRPIIFIPKRPIFFPGPRAILYTGPAI